EKTLPVGGWLSTVFSRVTLRAKLASGEAASAILEKELSLGGSQRPIDPAILGPDAVSSSASVISLDTLSRAGRTCSVADDRFVSQREFAKHVGRSHVWINRLVKEGRLPSDERGRVPLEAGLRIFATLSQTVDPGVVAHNEKQ